LGEKMPPQFTQVPEMSIWSQCIGGLVINFGIAEFMTLRCVELHSGASAALAIRKNKLSDRIAAAKESVQKSNRPAEQKKRATELWDEISKLSKVRNRVAHNPLLAGLNPTTQKLVFSVVDLQKMVPVGENALEPLDHTEIAATALRVREITRELSGIMESAPS
jgi:hypothetical protein